MRVTKNLRPALQSLSVIFLAGALFAAGCSTGNNSSGLNLITPQGSHPAGFVATHPALAVTDVAQCTPCHGNDLAGGISQASCFSPSLNGAACHHVSPTWEDPAEHGASAKRAPGNSGFASCRICHGNDFSGGGAGVACADCHDLAAPHPGPKTEKLPGWLPGDPYTHVTTDQANAPVCANCHVYSPPAPAGTPPGCYNNTLCHGVEVASHILGATWRDPTSSAFHGLTAKDDLTFCQNCHGTPGTILFDGGTAATSCADCHTTAKAHPTTWYQGSSSFPDYRASHRNSGNRSVACAICHNVTGPGAGPMTGAPSCFSANYSNSAHGSVECHSGGP